MSLWLTRIARRLAALLATVILGGILTAVLVRSSPGFDTDERLLDPRLDRQSRAAIQAEHAADHDVVRFYARYVGNMFRGDWGVSSSLKVPIRGLIGSRLPLTAELMAFGLAGAWGLATLLALAAVRYSWWSHMGSLLSIVVLSVPSAALAVLIFASRGPVRAIIALILFPRLFDYLRNLLADAYSRPHIITARAKGVGPFRILIGHVLPVCAPQFLALAGVSASMAFGAAIPVETLCDLPGVGQLAWKAAMARDLPLLVSLTMLITLLTQACNAVSDWAVVRRAGARS
ncbi:MAG TPA: ABC transporter permease [Bryobacteraceae bacterium]